MLYVNVVNGATDEELFKQVMQGVADKLGYNMDFLYGGWRVVFTDPQTKMKYELLGYDIGLNNNQSSLIARDKALCYEYLNNAGVPAIEHYVFPIKYKIVDNDVTKGVLLYIKERLDFPLVVKPNNGAGGSDIHFVMDSNELVMAVSSLSCRNKNISLSPYYEFDIEYRCTVLDGKVVMSYGKTKGENRQNNLCKGAKVVDVPEQLKSSLYRLAVRGVGAVGLRFANIDIVETAEGLKVLEVNNTVALKRCNRNSVERMEQSINVYVQALTKVRDERLMR